MDKIFLAYENAKQNAIRGDYIDKLHSKYTVILLFTISIFIGLRQSEDKSITCWLPTHFSDDQAAYSHQLCWVNNTYYYPHVTDANLFPENSKYTLHYYQYILFILFGQALLFLLPITLWSLLASNSAGYIKKILDQVQKNKVIENLASKKQEKKLKDADKDHDAEPLLLEEEMQTNLVKNFDFLIKIENENNKKEYNNKFNDNFDENENPSFKKIRKALKRITSKISEDEHKVLSFMTPKTGLANLAKYYIALKVFNFLNVLVQFIFLNILFGSNFYRYGIDFFLSLYLNKNPLQLSTQFPIITFCDFYIHQNLRQIYFNTAQCLLYINVLIEKFFIIIWFWLLFLLLVTFLNIVSWIRELNYASKISFLNKYIKIRVKMGKGKDFDLEKIKDFYSKYLTTDGVLMLHMIKSVAGELIFMDLLYLLLLQFDKPNQQKKELEFFKEKSMAPEK